MRLVLTLPAKKDLLKLDKKTESRIRLALDKFLASPRSVDLKKLQGQANHWRIRVGEWRIILGMEKDVVYWQRAKYPECKLGDMSEQQRAPSDVAPHEVKALYVLGVKHRREVYR